MGNRRLFIVVRSDRRLWTVTTFRYGNDQVVALGMQRFSGKSKAETLGYTRFELVCIG